jgi:hypothetical protein
MSLIPGLTGIPGMNPGLSPLGGQPQGINNGVPGINGVQGGGFPFLTGFGQSTFPGGFSNTSFGTPGILGFGFPTPFVDPALFSIPSTSSFFLNILLGSAAGLSVPINFGPIPSTLGFPPLLLGVPILGGATGQTPQALTGGNPFQQLGPNSFGANAVANPLGGLNPFGGLGGIGGSSIFGVNSTGVPSGQPGFTTFGGFGGFG